MTIKEKITEICKNAKAACPELSTANSKHKNKILDTIASLLRDNTDMILKANEKDIASAEQNGVRQTMIDRLRLTKERINSIADSIADVIKLEDPCGSGDEREMPQGIKIKHIRVPIGVIGMIFEARPNVTVDAAVLCIKTGNVCILKGGKEAINTNIALVSLIRKALKINAINENACSLIQYTEREATNLFIEMKGYIDLLIPRGGKGLINFVKENAKVPIIETGAGNCHIYVDESADISKSITVTVNAKCQRPSVCNAAESLLVHENIAKSFLPKLKEELDKFNVELRGCNKTRKIIECSAATDEDFYTEYNDYIMSVLVVKDLASAICHINSHSTGHSECIMTESEENAEKFTSLIDSAAVYVNASTRFTDGGEFGLGAEIGISTQKLHARGPMGLLALTSEKYIVYGNGTIRQ